MKFSLVFKGRKFYNWFWIKTTFWLFKKEKSSDYSPGLLRKIFIFPKKRIHWSIKFRVFNLKNVALPIVALWKVRQSRVKINNWVWQKAFEFCFLFLCYIELLHKVFLPLNYTAIHFKTKCLVDRVKWLRICCVEPELNHNKVLPNTLKVRIMRAS